MQERLNGMIERLWKQDEIESTEKDMIWTKEEQMVEEHFLKTHYRVRKGRFAVKIPFKPIIETIGS